jgi:uncharacterized protein YoaH (UPF0181 family)
VLHKNLNVSCKYFLAVERVQRLIEKGVSSVPSAQVIIAALNEEEGIGPTIAELSSNSENWLLG